MDVLKLTTTEFLHILFPDGIPDGGFLESRIDTGSGIARAFATDFAGLLGFATSYYHTAKSIWFGPGVRSGPKGTDADVKWLSSIWVDCDAKCFPERSKEEAYAHLRFFEFPPDIIIDSGHGMQGYWLVDGFLTGDTLLQAQSVMRAVENRLSNNLPRKLDPTHNPSRVMRLPNTVNRKEQDHAVCRVVYMSLQRSYKGVLAALSNDPVADIIFSPSYDMASFTDGLVRSVTDLVALVDKALADGMPYWVQDALRRPDIHHKGDTSRLDWAVCCQLTQYLSLSEAEAVWLHSPLGQRPGDNKVVARPDYRRRTLWRAREQGRNI